MLRNVIETIEPVDSQERFEGIRRACDPKNSGAFISKTEVQAGDTISSRPADLLWPQGSGPFVPPIPGLETVKRLYKRKHL